MNFLKSWMDILILDKWTHPGKIEHLVTLALHQVKGLFVMPSFHTLNRKISWKRYLIDSAESKCQERGVSSGGCK